MLLKMLESIDNLSVMNILQILGDPESPHAKFSINMLKQKSCNCKE